MQRRPNTWQHPRASCAEIGIFISSEPALCVSCRLDIAMDSPSYCQEHTTLEEIHQPLNSTRTQLFEPTPVYDSDASDSSIESQDIAGKRVNPAKLIALLRTKFGAGRFKIRVRRTGHACPCRDIADFRSGRSKRLHHTSPQASLFERDYAMQMKRSVHIEMHTRSLCNEKPWPGQVFRGSRPRTPKLCIGAIL